MSEKERRQEKVHENEEERKCEEEKEATTTDREMEKKKESEEKRKGIGLESSESKESKPMGMTQTGLNDDLELKGAAMHVRSPAKHMPACNKPRHRNMHGGEIPMMTELDIEK
ncbi:hypothetical protein RFI_20466, partial [Reticulomyxa filosa]